MPAAIDHLVVTAPTLDAGADYIRSALGVELDPGGEHARLGTHNRLLRLGDSIYLEVIAVDPQAPRPQRPRWFGLDAILPDTQPRLATWVARVAEIEAAAAACPDVGAVERMSRGALDWRITIPADGSAPLGGVMPSLIQWEADMHPAVRLPNRGCRLIALEGVHPQAERIRSALQVLHFHGPFTVSQGSLEDAPRLTASIDTPHGLRHL